VPPFELGRAVGADLGEALKVVALNGSAVVAAAVRSVPYQAAFAPSLGGGNVPDVLVDALQAESRLGAQLLCHQTSLIRHEGALGVDQVCSTISASAGCIR